MSVLPPAGWYDDGHGTQRWWDGAHWGVSAAEYAAAHPFPADQRAANAAAAGDGDDAKIAPQPEERERKAAVQQAERDAKAAVDQTDREAKKAATVEARAARKADAALTKAAAAAEREQARREKAIAKPHAEWERTMQLASAYLTLAETAQPSPIAPIMLQRNERLYAHLPAALVRDTVQRNYVAAHQGVSIPVGNIGGHAIRYNIGQTHGHIESSSPTPTIVDQGHVAITTSRIIYVGKTTLEHRFDRLVSYEPVNANEFVLSVTNRQKSTQIHLEREAAIQFAEMLEIAVADYRGTREELITELRASVAQINAQEPIAQ
ncbi:DUF2510 domain-containing protein [Microbacterium deminutum]|uniref:DUF2510 domain-containing protein n=1 Tax=Microbacterium deminutum TaxID=344164 RepID=A0ABN2RK25_9MICO